LVDSAFIMGLVLRLPVVLFALTIHEFMHAYSAYWCGDDTAYRAGRMTLNPLAHLDLIGTLALMFAPIGWAKPVPVQPLNYRRPRRDDIIVSGAGIAANFTIAVLLSLVMRALIWQGIWPKTGLGGVVVDMLFIGALVNFGLAVFNLLPIPPLDGSHILRNLLPLNAAVRYAEWSRHGMFLLMIVVLINWRTGFLAYPIIWLMSLFTGVRFHA